MAVVPPLKLTAMPAVRPSLAELLRTCALRAGLSRVREAKKFVLGNPRAWLGSAYHEVLAEAGMDKTDVTPAEVWDKAVDARHERAQTHPLDRRFSALDRWPGYHMIRAMAFLRAQEVLDRGGTEASRGRTRPSADSTPSLGHERLIAAADGRLVGRPDLIRDDAVIDYKTGGIFEHGEGNVVRASYVRQLQLYAFLAKESSGRWPTRGVLRPMRGLPAEIDLRPADCERTAAEALELLES